MVTCPDADTPIFFTGQISEPLDDRGTCTELILIQFLPVVHRQRRKTHLLPLPREVRKVLLVQSVIVVQLAHRFDAATGATGATNPAERPDLLRRLEMQHINHFWKYSCRVADSWIWR